MLSLIVPTFSSQAPIPFVFSYWKEVFRHNEDCLPSYYPVFCSICGCRAKYVDKVNASPSLANPLIVHLHGRLVARTNHEVAPPPPAHVTPPPEHVAPPPQDIAAEEQKKAEEQAGMWSRLPPPVFD